MAADTISQRYALIIGCSEYQHPDLARLQSPAADVKTLNEVLTDPRIGDFKVTTLVDKNCAELTRAIARFFKDKGRDDMLLIYYSGHGIRDVNGKLYLSAIDTERDILEATAIPDRFISELMDNSMSQRMLLILDCCYSGAFAAGAKAALGSSVDSAAAFKGNGYGRIILTATDALQFAWEGDRVLNADVKHSVFTHYLIEGLKTGSADVDRNGTVTVDELYSFVYEKVRSSTARQTPGRQSFAELGHLIVARNPRWVENGRQLPKNLLDQLASPYSPVVLGALQVIEEGLKDGKWELGEYDHAIFDKLKTLRDAKIAEYAGQVLAPYAPYVTMPRTVHNAIIAHARAGRPEMVCGVIRGRGMLALEAYAGRNIAAERIENYEIDPQTLMRHFEFEDVGDEMMGIYCSRLKEEAYPSSADAWSAYYPECVYFWCSLKSDNAPVIRAFRLTTHWMEMNIAPMRKTIHFNETHPRLFAYYQPVDGGIPEALRSVAAVAPPPFYVLYMLDEQGAVADTRIVSLNEFAIKIVNKLHPRGDSQ